MTKKDLIKFLEPFVDDVKIKARIYMEDGYRDIDSFNYFELNEDEYAVELTVSENVK